MVITNPVTPTPSATTIPTDADADALLDLVEKTVAKSQIPALTMTVKTVDAPIISRLNMNRRIFLQNTSTMS